MSVPGFLKPCLHRHRPLVRCTVSGEASMESMQVKVAGSKCWLVGAGLGPSDYLTVGGDSNLDQKQPTGTYFPTSFLDWKTSLSGPIHVLKAMNLPRPSHSLIDEGGEADQGS